MAEYNVLLDEIDFYQERVNVARFYFDRLLPRTLTLMLAATIRARVDSIAELA